MKAILTYENYYSYGKHYQFNFIYENELEAKKLSTFIKEFKKNQKIQEQIQPFYTRYLTKKNDNTINVISKTNIPKEILIPFISMLININKCQLTIGKNIYTNFNIDEINKAIDNLHLNASLNRGNFLTMGNTYYMTFNYASNEQKDELSYFFNCKSNYADINDVYRIMIDNYGNFTNKSNGTIIAINIPKTKLEEFIKTFIEDYNMIITIGNVKLKEQFIIKEYEKALSNLDINQFGRSRKKIMQDTK